MRRTEIIVLSVTVVAFAAVLASLILETIINTAQAIESTVLFVLVCVTAIYTKRAAETADAAKQQANANVKMAEEMANSRYDAFRPIIDIVAVPMVPTETLKKAFDARDGKFPEELPCVLRNIGIGPAVGVSSFIIVPSNGGQRPWDFGTIAVGEKTAEMGLSPQQTGGRMFLVAYYKDIYGRDVESRREVTLDKERHSWKTHPLETQVRKITEEGVE